jgi:hypothetical protein
MELTETTPTTLHRSSLGTFTIAGDRFEAVVLRFAARMRPQLAWIYRDTAEVGYLEGLPFGQPRFRLQSREATWPSEHDEDAVAAITALWQRAGLDSPGAMEQR